MVAEFVDFVFAYLVFGYLTVICCFCLVGLLLGFFVVLVCCYVGDFGFVCGLLVLCYCWFMLICFGYFIWLVLWFGLTSGFCWLFAFAWYDLWFDVYVYYMVWF